jgi:hypothetical protein
VNFDEAMDAGQLGRALAILAACAVLPGHGGFDLGIDYGELAQVGPRHRTPTPAVGRIHAGRLDRKYEKCCGPASAAPMHETAP